MGRMRNRLTDMQVKRAKDGWLNDGGNLHLRVGGEGRSKKWVFRYVRGGKAVEIGLGAVSQGVSLKLARELRDRHMAALAKGLDPRTEKRKLAAGRKTFGEAAQEVIEAGKKRWRTSVNDGRTSSLDEWTKSLMIDCKAILDRPVEAVTTADIKPIVMRHWDDGREVTARRLVDRAATVFDYAKAHGWREGDNPAAWSVFKHILQAQGPTGPQPHHPALDWRETPAFMARLRATEPTMGAMALELMILTATRSGEARGMKWDEIDFDTATWTIPAERMKRKLAHDVPLSADAVALLRKLEAGQIGGFVFPGRSNAKPIAHHAAWDLVQRLNGREVGKVATATPHGFRSSARSWMAAHGVPHDVAEACLAHAVGNAVSQAYNRENLLKQRRKVMSDWAAFLSGAAADNVIALKRGVA